MKKVAAITVGMFGLCANAFGGIVLFAPEEVQVVQGSGPVDVTFAVIGDGGTGIGLDAFDVIVGSQDVAIQNLVFGQDVLNNFPNTSVAVPAGFGYYANEVYGSASRTQVLNVATLPIGMLSIDASTLPLGQYEIGVDSDTDQGLSNIYNRGSAEAINGSAPVVVVVPEPASLSLLALGAVAAAVRFGRRRTA